MGKSLVFPIVGPTTIYPNGQRSLYVDELAENYENQGYKVIKDKKWDVRIKNIFLWPHYIKKESLFSDCVESLVMALEKNYDVSFIMDDKGTLVDLNTSLDHEKVLVLPFCMKGCSAALQLNERYRFDFENQGYVYVQDINHTHYTENDKVFLDPIMRDRTSYRTFSMNLLLAVSRGFSIYPLLINK